MDANGGMSNNNGDSRNKRAGEAARNTIEQCPRCYSSNTKFCYFNNYSLSQPRHYCRNCKRHWTKGGALRNVPVGGNRYKNRRARVAPNLNGAMVQAAVQQHHARAASAAFSVVGARATAAVVAGRNGGRFINFSNPFDARFSSFRRSAMASYAPMPLLSASGHAAVMAASNRSFLQELNNNRSHNNVVGNNNVSLGFGNFPPLQPISGAGAWQEESLMMRSNPSDHMLCLGFDDASGSGLNNDGGIGGLPNMNDIDFFDSNLWADDLPDFSPPPPPSA